MATNVMVVCRFRPPSKNEKAEGATIVANVDPNNTIVSLNDGSGVVTPGSTKFNFDRVFDFTSSQAEVFEHTGKPMVKEVFAGFNTTIFAYGQTGSGKTHSMMGNTKIESEKGIIPRLVDAIFNGIEEAEVGIEFTVKLSYIEIYLERVRDLLTARTPATDNLKIREGTHGGVYIEGVVECFPERETRVLTHRGFLYLDEIEECERQGIEMQYACYDRATKTLVYSRGGLVKPTAVPTHLVDFTQRHTRAHWDAGSDDYGVESSAEANHLSLLVTPGHRMYVQVGERRTSADAHVRSNAGTDIDFQEILAEELTAGFDCRCTADNIPGRRSVEHPCMHFRNEKTAVRFLGHVVGGFGGAANLPELPALETDEQLAAFLRLYGYWLGAGSFHFGLGNNAYALKFATKRDRQWLLASLTAAGLREIDDFRVTTSVADRTTIVHVTKDDWRRFFFAEYGIRYAAGRVAAVQGAGSSSAGAAASSSVAPESENPLKRKAAERESQPPVQDDYAEDYADEGDESDADEPDDSGVRHVLPSGDGRVAELHTANGRPRQVMEPFAHAYHGGGLYQPFVPPMACNIVVNLQEPPNLAFGMNFHGSMRALTMRQMERAWSEALEDADVGAAGIVVTERNPTVCASGSDIAYAAVWQASMRACLLAGARVVVACGPHVTGELGHGWRQWGPADAAAVVAETAIYRVHHVAGAPVAAGSAGAIAVWIVETSHPAHKDTIRLSSAFLIAALLSANGAMEAAELTRAVENRLGPLLDTLQRLAKLGVRREDVFTKSAKWLADWVFRLSRDHVRMVIEGLHLADGCSGGQQLDLVGQQDDQPQHDGKKEIYTSSASFRDQLLRAFLHAGYGSYFRVAARAGSVGGWTRVGERGKTYTSAARAALVTEEPEAEGQFRPIRATCDGWKVIFLPPKYADAWVDMVDVQYNGGQPASSAAPATSSASPAQVPYQPDKHGRIWCVQVEHGDRLIIAQRAHRNSAGVTTKVGKAVVVGNCYVNSIEQVMQMLQQGQDNRAIASTNMNEQSSRSHSVFILTLGQLDQNTGSKKGAKLTLVDLAGSEKVGKTGAAGQTLVEAQAINKSLSALGNVINALTSQGAHIPYRDSKLTRLLSDSLGGNSKTVLAVTCVEQSTPLLLPTGATILARDVTTSTRLVGQFGEAIPVTQVTFGDHPSMITVHYRFGGADGAVGHHTVTPNHLVTLVWTSSPKIDVDLALRARAKHLYATVFWFDRTQLKLLHAVFRYRTPDMPAHPVQETAEYATQEEATAAALTAGDRLVYEGKATEYWVNSKLFRNKKSTYVVLKAKGTDGWTSHYFKVTAIGQQVASLVLPPMSRVNARAFVVEWMAEMERLNLIDPLRSGDVFDVPADQLTRLLSVPSVSSHVALPVVRLQAASLEDGPSSASSPSVVQSADGDVAMSDVGQAAQSSSVDIADAESSAAAMSDIDDDAPSEEESVSVPGDSVVTMPNVQAFVDLFVKSRSINAMPVARPLLGAATASSIKPREVVGAAAASSSHGISSGTVVNACAQRGGLSRATITSVEVVGGAQYVAIAVASNERRFVLADGILTHNCSPMSTNLEETISTLRFGTRAKMIKNKATINQERSVGEYKMLLNQATVKIGIQGNIIEVLEKDVANLLECIQAVDEQYLKIPIPALLSRDVSVLESMKKSKSIEFDSQPTAIGVGGAGGDAVSRPHTPPPDDVDAIPVAAAVAAAGAPVAAAAQPAKATIRPAPSSGDSNSSSPATSPDVSPTASPVVKPSPPVVTVGLPSLASLSAGGAAAPSGSSATAAAPSSGLTLNPTTPSAGVGGTPFPSSSPHRKNSSTSAMTAHSLSELMLTNSDLSQKLSELQTLRRALENNLEDSRQEAKESAETFEKEKAKMQLDVEAALRAKKDAEEKAEKALEVVNELTLLKQKLEYMKKEHALEMSQAEAGKTELSEEVQRLSTKVASLEQKMVAQSKAYESVLEKVAQDNAALAGASSSSVPEASSTPASAPTTPQDKDKSAQARNRARMSAPPEHTQPREQLSAGEPHPLLSKADPFAYTEPTFTIEEQSQIEQLNRGLKRKCDQYIQLMMQHQTQGERVESLEASLEDANQRLKEHVATSAKKIKELDEKLLAAENLCAKFLESGRYWRQERSQKSKATTSKIVMPIASGGGKAKPAELQTPIKSVPPASPASNVAGSSSALSPSPSPATPSSSSSSSRLSGGIASGARSALTSIQNAISSKPKPPPSADSMSQFF